MNLEVLGCSPKTSQHSEGSGNHSQGRPKHSNPIQKQHRDRSRTLSASYHHEGRTVSLESEEARRVQSAEAQRLESEEEERAQAEQESKRCMQDSEPTGALSPRPQPSNPLWEPETPPTSGRLSKNCKQLSQTCKTSDTWTPEDRTPKKDTGGTRGAQSLHCQQRSRTPCGHDTSTLPRCPNTMVGQTPSISFSNMR